MQFLEVEGSLKRGGWERDESFGRVRTKLEGASGNYSGGTLRFVRL